MTGLPSRFGYIGNKELEAHSADLFALSNEIFSSLLANTKYQDALLQFRALKLRFLEDWDGERDFGFTRSGGIPTIEIPLATTVVAENRYLEIVKKPNLQLVGAGVMSFHDVDLGSAVRSAGADYTYEKVKGDDRKPQLATYGEIESLEQRVLEAREAVKSQQSSAFHSVGSLHAGKLA